MEQLPIVNVDQTMHRHIHIMGIDKVRQWGCNLLNEL
jgi:hypothetical protein